MTAFGVHFVFDGESLDRPRVAALLSDARWPVAMPLLMVRPVPGSGVIVEKRTLARATARDAIVAAFASPTTLQVGVTASRTERDNNAWIYVDAGREPYPDGRFTYNLRALARDPSEAWIELVHELAAGVGAAHGSIIAHRDEAILRSELWAQHESHEGREVHPDPGLITSLATKRYGLGDRWVRPARWGTYLSAAHVAEVGGRDRICNAVKPAVAREVAALLYLQLSSLAEAVAPATLAQQEALSSILAPLALPPS
jgi:hypothetical protein